MDDDVGESGEVWIRAVGRAAATAAMAAALF